MAAVLRQDCDHGVRVMKMSQSEYILYIEAELSRRGRAFVFTEKDVKNAQWVLRGPHGEIVEKGAGMMEPYDLFRYAWGFYYVGKIECPDCESIIDTPRVKVWEITTLDDVADLVRLGKGKAMTKKNLLKLAHSSAKKCHVRAVQRGCVYDIELNGYWPDCKVNRGMRLLFTCKRSPNDSDFSGTGVRGRAEPHVAKMNKWLEEEDLYYNP